MPLPKEFTDRIGDTPIRMSKFENSAGLWAKLWINVFRVKVVFDDGVVVYLTPGEFHSLPIADQNKIYNAPSGA